MFRLIMTLSTLIGILAAAPTFADTSSADGDAPAILVIDRGGDGLLAMTRADLEGLEQHEVRTTTEWTDGVSTFRGPLARDVLAAAGELDTGAGSVLAIALNDYSVRIPMEDFQRYRVVLALTLDGEQLTRRDKGPIWIAYPRDDHAELQDPAMNSRWIWQLKTLRVR